MTLRLHRIHFPVTTLGPGRRIGIWVQGCSLECRGCLSRDTWEASPSSAVAVDEVLSACRHLVPTGPDGVTISGGEPFEQPEALGELLAGLVRWRAELGVDIDLLCYSGMSLRRLRTRFSRLLERLDGVIPEPFLEDRPLGGPWRGSDNQPLVPLSPLGRRRYAAAGRQHDPCHRRRRCTQ